VRGKHEEIWKVTGSERRMVGGERWNYHDDINREAVRYSFPKKTKRNE
jgi:hypothetical protein